MPAEHGRKLFLVQASTLRRMPAVSSTIPWNGGWRRCGPARLSALDARVRPNNGHLLGSAPAANVATTSEPIGRPPRDRDRRPPMSKEEDKMLQPSRNGFLNGGIQGSRLPTAGFGNASRPAVRAKPAAGLECSGSGRHTDINDAADVRKLLPMSLKVFPILRGTPTSTTTPMYALPTSSATCGHSNCRPLSAMPGSSQSVKGSGHRGTCQRFLLPSPTERSRIRPVRPPLARSGRPSLQPRSVRPQNHLLARRENPRTAGLRCLCVATPSGRTRRPARGAPTPLPLRSRPCFPLPSAFADEHRTSIRPPGSSSRKSRALRFLPAIRRRKPLP